MRRRALFSVLQLPPPSEQYEAVPSSVSHSSSYSSSSSLSSSSSPSSSSSSSSAVDALLLYQYALRRGGALALDRCARTGGASMRGWQRLERDLRWLSCRCVRGPCGTVGEPLELLIACARLVLPSV